MTEKNGSEFSGKVPLSKKHPLTITKKDEPIASLVPADETNMHLSKAKGWLENDDPFFDELDRIMQDRTKHVPRVSKEFLKYKNRIHTGPGKIEDDIKQARQSRMEKYR